MTGRESPLLLSILLFILLYILLFILFYYLLLFVCLPFRLPASSLFLYSYFFTFSLCIISFISFLFLFLFFFFPPHFFRFASRRSQQRVSDILQVERAARDSERAGPSVIARFFATTSKASPSRRSVVSPVVAVSSVFLPVSCPGHSAHWAKLDADVWVP